MRAETELPKSLMQSPFSWNGPRTVRGAASALSAALANKPIAPGVAAPMTREPLTPEGNDAGKVYRGGKREKGKLKKKLKGKVKKSASELARDSVKIAFAVTLTPPKDPRKPIPLSEQNIYWDCAAVLVTYLLSLWCGERA